MKPSSRLPFILLTSMVVLLCQCTTTAHKTADRSLSTSRTVTPVVAPPPAKTEDVKPALAVDDLDEYAVVEIKDPLEGLNRATFWFNDKLYLIICRPLAKGYETVLPKRARKGIDNAFVNVQFPVRFVNCLLQGKVKRAGQETEKFLLNTIAGVGGLYRMSDKVASLADLPAEDTGKTLAKWGFGHGAYIVIPFFGPSSIRDGIGLAGDYALNPVNWGYFVKGKPNWTLIPPTANTLSSLPTQLSAYDEAKGESVDPYIAIRSAYVQFRNEAIKK